MDSDVATVVADAVPNVSSSIKFAILILPSDKVPKVTVPVVVIADEPLFIDPNPDVIEPPFNAPTLVMFVCAAVDKVPTIEVLAVRVVNVPAAGVVPPITELSITAPSRFIATDVPVALNKPSTVSRSALSFVPQVSVDAPTSGFVKLRLVVNVSAIKFYPLSCVLFA